MTQLVKSVGATVLVVLTYLASALAQPSAGRSVPVQAINATPSATPSNSSEDAAATAALERGIALFKQRQFVSAAQALEQAQKAPLMRSEVVLMLGICYYKIGSLTQAEPLLRQALKDPDPETQDSARVFLGLLFQEQGALDQARAELDRVAGSPTLRDSAQNLLKETRPHRLSLTFLLSPEYDGNVPLTNYGTWSSNPQGSADGDMLFLGSISARPLVTGLTFGDTLSYRQQFQQSAYDLLLNSTWLGYSYLGIVNRIRGTVQLTYAMLGGSTLYVDIDARAWYRRRLHDKLGFALYYDGHYRDYINTDYLTLSGFLQSLQAELGWGLAPQPLSAGISYQVIREQTVPGIAGDGSDDFRAWAHGPALWLRARLHRRVELALYGTFLQRLFDYFPATDGSPQRIDHVYNADLSLNINLRNWLELFVGGAVIYNDSNNNLFMYLKPTAYLGMAAHFALL